MNIKMKLELPSVHSSELIVRTAVSAFAAQANPTFEETVDIKTAVGEAVTNCIIHAYPDKCGSIYVTATLTGNSLSIVIRDRGVGICNVEEARRALYSTLPDSSGMGFTIMESFMDKVTVRSTRGQGTTVTLKKVIGGKL